MAKRKVSLKSKRNFASPEPSSPTPVIFSKGLCYSPEYQHVRYCSHREIKLETSKTAAKWLKLDVEIQRLLLLYNLQLIYLKATNRPISPNIYERIKDLETTNSHGEWAPLMDTPSSIDPISNKRVSKKQKRAMKKLEQHQTEVIKEKSKIASSPATPEIEKLLKEKQTASPERQRKIRQQLRKLNYHLSKV